MNSRAFTTKVEMYHRLWLGNLLTLNLHFSGGIDLYDDAIGVELKCRYQRWNHSFAVGARQISRFQEDNQGKELFWAFLFYDLENPPRRIRRRDIGKHIFEREVWLLPWDWIKQFPISTPKTGPYVYVHRKDFPGLDYFTPLDSRLEVEGTVPSQKPKVIDYLIYVPKGYSSLEERLDLLPAKDL